MPKTPPLLLPYRRGLTNLEKVPPVRPLPPPSSSTNYLIPRLLEPVMEEENETSFSEENSTEEIDADMISSSQRNVPSPQPNSLSSPTTTQQPAQKQSKREMVTYKGNTSFPDQQPSKSTDDKRTSKKDSKKKAPTLTEVYNATSSIHEDIKGYSDDVASFLTKAENDQKQVIQYLKDYKKYLQYRCFKLHQRWLQCQHHAQALIRLPPVFDDDNDDDDDEDDV